MTRRRLRTPCLLALAALPLIAACGGEDSAPAPSTAGAAAVQSAPGPARPAASASRAAPEAATTVVIEMAGSQFVPAQITVARGHAIRWSNADPIAHTVTATSGASFDSPTIEAGGQFRWTATRSGRVAYMCRFHPGMTATIVVQ